MASARGQLDLVKRLAARPVDHPRLLDRLIAACGLTLLAPLLWPLLTGRVFVYNDLSWFHLPLRHLFQQALLAGDSLLWTPAIFSGLYLHGEGQGGFLHPLHLALYGLLPLTMGLGVELAASYPVAFAGMAWFLRRLDISRTAALFGALLFTFSGFMLLHHHHVNMVAVVAHLPWLLATADVLIVDDRAARQRLALAGLAGLLGSALLLGFPQAVWWNGLALTTFAVLRARARHRWGRLRLCAGGVLLGVLVGGVQLLPTLDAVAHSLRSGATREFALSFSLHPLNLFQLWSPGFFARGAHSVDDYMWFHEFGVYSGAILPVAALWVWTRWAALPERRGMMVAVTAVVSASCLLALGRYGGLATLLTHVPLVGSLRAPARYILFVQFGLAMLAALALDDLLAIADGRRAPARRGAFAIWIPAVLGVASTVALNARLLPFGQHTFASAAAAAPGVAMIAVVTLLVHLSGRRVTWALPALILVTTADLAAWGIRFVLREPAQPLATLTRDVPPAPIDPADAYASAPPEGRMRSNLPVLAGYRLSSGYVGLFPATRHPLESEEALRLSGTRWAFAADGTRRAVEGSVARVRLLDLRRQEASGTARLAVDRPGRLVAHVSIPDRRIVALTERFHDGWTAVVDGAPAQVVRVEGDFLGCVVDAGIHRVELRFLPRSFVYGAIVTAAGLLMVALLIASGLRKAARPVPARQG